MKIWLYGDWQLSPIPCLSPVLATLILLYLDSELYKNEYFGPSNIICQGLRVMMMRSPLIECLLCAMRSLY